MVDSNEQSIKQNTPRTFKCDFCQVEEEALPWGTKDIQGATQFVYSLPEKWWSISVREGMKLFCGDEAVVVMGGKVINDFGTKWHP